MSKCIVKTAPEYGALKDRVQSELLADAILQSWWKGKGNDDRYPDEEYISKFLNKIGSIHFDDDSNDYFYDEDNSDESKYDFADDLATIDSEKATQEEIDAKEYHGTGTVLSAPLKLDIDQARDEIAKVAQQGGFARHEGANYRPTGMTSRLGEEYDPMNGPVKRNPASRFTHAGSAIHEMLDDAVKMILENPRDFEDSPSSNIAKALKAKKQEGGYSHYDLANISDAAIDGVARTISELRWKYDFVSSEIPLSGTDATDRQFNCAIDLIVRDRQTGAIGLLDYKTQTEKGDGGESKFNLYHKLKTPSGTSKYDNLQIQTLTYKSLLNDKYKQATGTSSDIINFRGFIPISIDMDSNGNVSRADVADINNAERVGSVYYLKDTSSYRNTVAEKFGLGADDIHKAQAFENKIHELKEVVQSAAEHYAKKSGKAIMKDVLNPLSGFNIMSDLPSIIKASKEFCSKTTTILNNRPEDVENIYRTQVAWQSMSDVAGSLTQHVQDGFLDNYVAAISDVPREQKERYSQDLRNAITDFVNDVNNLKESVSVARKRELMNHRDEFRQIAFEHHVLNGLREQAFKDIKAGLAEQGKLDKFSKDEYWQEATDKAMTWYEQNPTVYDNKVNNVIDKLMYLSGHNEISSSFAKRWLSPIANTRNNFVGYLVKTIDDGNSKVATASRADRKLIEQHVKELTKLTGKGKAKDIYGFMFDWRDVGDGKKAARIVTEFRDRDMESAKFQLTDIAKRIGNWGEEDMQFLANHLSEDALMEISTGNLTEAKTRYLLYKGFKDNNYSLKDGITISQANRHTRNSVLEGLKDLAYKGFISDSDLRTAKSHLRSMVDMILPEAFSKNKGEDAPWKQYARELYYQHQYEVYTPTDKWRNHKHDFIRSLDDNDPRKKFYNLYKEITSEYDKYADDTKKIHDNLPSLLDNHGSGFFRKDRINKEYNKSRVGDKSWFSTCENQEQHARIPLPFTGYQLDPDRQNYDLGLGLFKLKDSLNNYKEFSSRVAGIELMYDHLAENTGFKKDGAFKQAEDDELVRLRKYIDRALYKSSKDPKWIKSVNTLLSVFSIRALALNPLVALNSHYMSASTLRTLGLGKDGIASHKGFSTAWLNFCKNAIMGKPVADYFTRDAATKNSRIQTMLGMYDNKYKYERFGSNNAFKVNNKAQLKDEIINQTFTLLRATDGTHRSIWSEAMCRSLEVFDNDGKSLGSLYDNLEEDGNTMKPNSKVAYTDKNKIHKFDLNQLRREMQQLISRTTQPQSDIDRPVMSFSALGRTTSMFRNIGLNFWSSAMTRDRINPLTGQEEVGFIANLMNRGAVMGSLGEIGLGPAKVKNFTEAFQRYLLRPLAKMAGSETAQSWGSDIAGKNLTKSQKKACQQLGQYATMYALAYIAKNAFLNGKLTASSFIPFYNSEEDKEERSNLFNNKHAILSPEWLRLLGARLCLGVMASLNPVDFFSGMNPGGIAVSTGKDVYNFIDQLIEDAMSEASQWARRSGKGLMDFSEYQSGVHEGESKLYRKFLKATGVGNIPDRISNIQNTVKYLNEQ